jgi:hypothetical protein
MLAQKLNQFTQPVIIKSPGCNKLKTLQEPYIIGIAGDHRFADKGLVVSYNRPVQYRKNINQCLSIV